MDFMATGVGENHLWRELFAGGEAEGNTHRTVESGGGVVKRTARLLLNYVSCSARADLVSSYRGKLQLSGADEPGWLRAFEGVPIPNQFISRYLARTPVGNGRCSGHGRHRS